MARKSRTYLPINAAISFWMVVCDQAPLILPNMQDQISLMLCWCSFSRWGRDGIAICFACKAAKNSFMTEYNLLEVWFPRMHDQKSLMLHWLLFSWWGMVGISICFAYKGGQNFLCDWLKPIGGEISQDAWPKIVDAPLTLILMMAQGGYCSLCAYKEGQKFLGDWLQSIGGGISQDAWPKMVDAPLTHILPWLYAQYAII